MEPPTTNLEGDPSRTSPPPPKPKRLPNPMRGLIGDKHPSVNLPPLILPESERKPGTDNSAGEVNSAFATEDGTLKVGRDFNKRKFDPIANSKFMDDRAWKSVTEFAKRVVTGLSCLTELCNNSDTNNSGITLDPPLACDGEGVDPSGVFLKTKKPEKTKRFAYRFSVSYFGPGFTGWAWQGNDIKWLQDDIDVGETNNSNDSNNPSTRKDSRNDGSSSADSTNDSSDSEKQWRVGEYSVVAAVQNALTPLLNNGSKNYRPVYSAGRTDKGVHGVAQTVSFVSIDDLNENDLGFEKSVKKLIETSPAGKLGHLKVCDSPPPRLAHPKFHATFCATWRRYVYVFPIRQSLLEERTPVAKINVPLLNAMLNNLVSEKNTNGEKNVSGVDCYAFARDTIDGKDSFVKFKKARAFVGKVPKVKSEDVDTAYVDSDETTEEPVVVIELVANRFLRKLCRVLVATATREAATGAAPDVLLALAATRERSATASPAPPQGLFFAGVGYGDHPEFDRKE